LYSSDFVIELISEEVISDQRKWLVVRS